MRRAITTFNDHSQPSPTQITEANTLSEKIRISLFFLICLLFKEHPQTDEKTGIPSMGMLLDSLKDLETPPTKNLPKQFFAYDVHSPLNNLNQQKLMENQEKYAQKVEQEELSEIQHMLGDILNDKTKFQELNNLITIGPFSPFSKTNVSKAERYIEGAENIVKKWVKQLEETNKNCLAYTKSIESFGNQLLMDKSFFKNNLELQTFMTLIAQVLKEHAVYIEVFTQVVENSIEK